MKLLSFSMSPLASLASPPAASRSLASLASSLARRVAGWNEQFSASSGRPCVRCASHRLRSAGVMFFGGASAGAVALARASTRRLATAFFFSSLDRRPDGTQLSDSVNRSST